MKTPSKIKINDTASVEINSKQVQIFRKTKYVYIVQDLASKKICSGPSLPKVIMKAESLIEKPKKAAAKNAGGSKPKSSTTMKSITLDMIHEDDDDIVEAVKAEFPDSKFDKSHVSWYRSTMFRDGIIGPEFAPRRSKAYKLWKENQGK